MQVRNAGRWNGHRDVLDTRSVSLKSFSGMIGVHRRCAEEREILQLWWRNINMSFNGS